MNEETHEKLVNFAYCRICTYHDLTEKDEPCSTCIANPVNFESAKPIKYEQDNKAVKMEQEFITENKLHIVK